MGSRRSRTGSRGASRATPARVLAAQVLREVREREAYVREVVDARRDAASMPAEEFAYAQVLSFGVTMCRGTLDELVDRNLDSPRDVKAKVRDCLRVSAYELLFLGKPEHVVVDQGVELVRSVAPRATGLANAVLRKMACDSRRFPWGSASDDLSARARTFGMPAWLVERLEADHGLVVADGLLAASLGPAPTYLVDDPFRPGERFASDLSAQRVAALVDLDGTVLEIGAGRGTKTHLLQKRAFEQRGRTVRIDAVDLHAFKADLLAERMDRAGIEGVAVHVGDARDLSGIDGLAPGYSAVLVDAPCSGTGTLRRHPEIRWRLEPGDVTALARLQAEMLAQASMRVDAGGQLVYATCSVLAEENEAVAEAFLAGEAGERFELEEVDGCRWFSTVPTEGGPDGHFAACFRRVA